MNNENTGDSELIKCDDVQELLMEYASRELGESRSALVREHIRQCDKCQNAFSEIREMVEMLQKASAPDDELPDSLSDKHYARLFRTVMHPVLDWIVVNHKMVSIVIAVVVVIGTLIALHRVKEYRRPEENLDTSFEIILTSDPGYTSTNGRPVIRWNTKPPQ